MIPDSGYGFIRSEGHDKDIFFHRTGMIHSADFDKLHGGSKVSFELVISDRGPRAVSIEIDGNQE